MKFKTTKSALISSAIILAMCFSMFVGSTYAWFTDSVSSSGNVIQSGTLDVQFLMHNGTTYEDISDATKPIFGADSLLADWEPNVSQIWEPGKTQIVYLGVKNAGNLALKYNILVDVIDGGLVGALEYAIIDGAKAGALTLNDWDDVVAACNGQTADIAAGRTLAAANGAIVDNDAADYFALAIHMKEEANNEYQNKSITVDINVVATQLANEEDSFGPNYDADASLDYYYGSGTLNEGGSAVEIEVRDEADNKVASAVIPAGAIKEGVNNVQVNVTPAAPHANITVAADREVKGFDVSILGLKEGNTEPVKVELRIPAGLDPATVQLYHYDQAIAFTYNPNDGYVTFESATFSPFTVVYDAESEYVAPEVDENTTRPTAKVDYASEYVNTEIEWGNYGQWSPTAGFEANLEAAFVFACPEEDDGTFDNWYCDFYVSLDKALGENQIFLGGNYGSFGWVGFHNGDLTLDANTEIGLLESVTTNPWTYSDVKNYVGEFTCGVGDVNDALEGATFTVKLRLTNPADEDEFYDVNVVTYTFGGNAVIDGATVALTAQDIQDAVNGEGDSNIVLGGDIDLNDLVNGLN